MKQLFIILLMSSFVNIYATDHTSTLAVSGYSKLMVTPDITVINIEISTINTDYNNATHDLNQKSENIKELLRLKGIKDKHIKSENFEINKRYDYKNNARVYMGYEAKLNIQLEFLNDNDFANKITNIISSNNTEAEVNINFILSDSLRNTTNDNLIKLAIQDAKRKAMIIASETNQELSHIENINYGIVNNTNSQASLNYSLARKSISYDKQENTNFTITPRQQTLSTQIEIYWMLNTKE